MSIKPVATDSASNFPMKSTVTGGVLNAEFVDGTLKGMNEINMEVKKKEVQYIRYLLSYENEKLKSQEIELAKIHSEKNLLHREFVKFSLHPTIYEATQEEERYNCLGELMTKDAEEQLFHSKIMALNEKYKKEYAIRLEVKAHVDFLQKELRLKLTDINRQEKERIFATHSRIQSPVAMCIHQEECIVSLKRKSPIGNENQEESFDADLFFAKEKKPKIEEENSKEEKIEKKNETEGNIKATMFPVSTSKSTSKIGQASQPIVPFVNASLKRLEVAKEYNMDLRKRADCIGHLFASKIPEMDGKVNIVEVNTNMFHFFVTSMLLVEILPKTLNICIWNAKTKNYLIVASANELSKNIDDLMGSKVLAQGIEFVMQKLLSNGKTAAEVSKRQNQKR